MSFYGFMPIHLTHVNKPLHEHTVSDVQPSIWLVAICSTHLTYCLISDVTNGTESHGAQHLTNLAFGEAEQIC